MSDFSKLKVKKNGKEYILNACTQDTEQDIIGTKNFSKLTVNGKNIVRSVNGVNADNAGNVTIQSGNFLPDYTAGVSKSNDTEYTAEKDGWLYVFGENTTNKIVTNIIEIDGVQLKYNYAHTGGTGTVSSGFLIPICKGSTYRGINCKTMIYFPCKE